MAIYAVRGACAAAYIAYGYKVYVEGFNPQLYFSDWKKNTRDGSVSSIVRELAQNMGLEKNIIVVEGSETVGFGSTISRRSAVMQVTTMDYVGTQEEFLINFSLARIKANDMALWSLVPLIAALFTTFALNRRSPIGSCCAGLAAGVSTFMIVGWWRVSVAGQRALFHSSNEAKQEILYLMKVIQSKGNFWRKLVITFFMGPLGWHIRTVENYIQQQPLIEKG